MSLLYIRNKDTGEFEPVKALRGEQGTTFTPSVSEDGTLSWTNDGGLANPDPVNIKGPAGDNGDGEGGAQYINELLPDPNEESVDEENVVLPVNADNSDKLGGKEPEYYAKQETVTQLSQQKVDKANVVNNFTVTEEGFVADARTVKELNDKFNGLIWISNKRKMSFEIGATNVYNIENCIDASRLIPIIVLDTTMAKVICVSNTWADGTTRHVRITNVSGIALPDIQVQVVFVNLGGI